MERMTSSRRGKVRKISEEGKGECRKMPHLHGGVGVGNVSALRARRGPRMTNRNNRRAGRAATNSCPRYCNGCLLRRRSSDAEQELAPGTARRGSPRT